MSLTYFEPIGKSVGKYLCGLTYWRLTRITLGKDRYFQHSYRLLRIDFLSNLTGPVLFMAPSRDCVDSGPAIARSEYSMILDECEVHGAITRFTLKHFVRATELKLYPPYFATQERLRRSWRACRLLFALLFDWRFGSRSSQPRISTASKRWSTDAATVSCWRVRINLQTTFAIPDKSRVCGPSQRGWLAPSFITYPWFF